MYRFKKNIGVKNDSPNTKVESLTKGLKIPLSIKKKLLFGEAFKAELNENLRCASDEKEKQMFRKVLSGPIIRKYKLIGEVRQLISHKMHKKHRSNQNFKQYERKKRNERLTYIIRHQIQEFLERDCNSKMCPGKKDFVKYGKFKKQKRLLLDTLYNLHKKFTEERENIKISYASFRRHKPFWIVSPRNKDRETCACVKHANIDLMIKRLFALQLVETGSSEELINKVVCDPTKKDCMFGRCATCNIKQYKCKLRELHAPITFQQWQTVKEKKTIKGKEREIKRTVKLEREDIVQNAFKTLNLQLHSFKRHVFTMRHQSEQLRQKKLSLGPDEILIQVDFSENYVIKYSHEIQSMHFGASKRQISLHTGLYYFHDQDKRSTRSQCFCSVSDTLDHQAYAVWAHLDKILRDISSTFPQTKSIHFFSDGPTSQYKNRFNLFFLQARVPMIFKSAENLSWNYSESGHGKGPMDGIGGTLKRKADALVLRGQDITTAADFVKKLGDSCIQLWEVTESEINKVKMEMPQKQPPVPCMLLVRQAVWNKGEENKIRLRELSCFACHFSVDCQHFSLKTYNLACILF